MPPELPSSSNRGSARGLGIGLLTRQEGVIHLGHIVDIPLSSSDANLSIITDAVRLLDCACWASRSRPV